MDKVVDQQSLAAAQWMVDLLDFRKRLFLRTIEPVIVFCLGPVEPAKQVEADGFVRSAVNPLPFLKSAGRVWPGHRRLGFLPNYVEDVSAFKDPSMSFATLMMLFIIMSCILLIFLSCFFHNQKTSPLFISPRRHRLPKLVPPPLPVDGYFDWVRMTQVFESC